MSIKRYQLYFTFCFTLLLFNALESRSQTNFNCSNYYYSIITEFNSGNFLAVDSLFESYKKTSCIQSDRVENLRFTEAIYKIIIKQRLRDGFRKNEADSLQGILNTITNRISVHQTTIPYPERISPWRISVSLKTTLTESISSGSSPGLLIGWHPQLISNARWGIDFGAYYRAMPFLTNTATGSDGMVYPTPNGISGKIKFYYLPLIFSYHLLKAKTGKFGLDLTGGGELVKTSTNFILNTYPSDSDVNTKDLYNDNSINKNKKYYNLTTGLCGFWKISSHSLISLSPVYSKKILFKPSSQASYYAQPGSDLSLKLSFVCIL